MDILLGAHYQKALAFQAYVTRVSNIKSVLLKEQMREPLLPIYLMQEIQVSDTLQVLKQEISYVMIPLPEYGSLLTT